jgi:hypothetical protein
MRLIPEWKRLLRRAWSIRLNLGAALLSAADTAWQTYTTGQPPIVAVITMVVSLSAAVARLVAQPKLHDGD